MTGTTAPGDGNESRIDHSLIATLGSRGEITNRGKRFLQRGIKLGRILPDLCPCPGIAFGSALGKRATGVLKQVNDRLGVGDQPTGKVNAALRQQHHIGEMRTHTFHQVCRYLMTCSGALTADAVPPRDKNSQQSSNGEAY